MSQVNSMYISTTSCNFLVLFASSFVAAIFLKKKERELDFNLLMFYSRILYVGQKGTSSVKKFI